VSSSVASPRKAPVRIEVDASTLAILGPSGAPAAAIRRKVAVVVPCFNRPRDLELLLGDLALLIRTLAPRTGGVAGGNLETSGALENPALDLRIIVVDNASHPPLEAVPVPDDLDVHMLRLDANTGGSGGFNAGMAHALGSLEHEGKPWNPDFLWLVDSDARVLPSTLTALLRALDNDPGLIAAGSAIAFPFPDGRVFEVGGRVDRRTGQFGPAARGVAGLPGPIVCDYVAACSALVRADAVRRAGLFPDVFLNGDDVEWFIRLAQRTGGRVAGVPDSVAFHPTFDRFPTLPRYYVARNGFGAMDALNLGRVARLFRAGREVARALGQTMMARDDLAALHLKGLAAAARGQILGPAPAGEITFDPFLPYTNLAAELAPLLGRNAAKATVKIFPNLGLSDADEAELDRQLAAAGLTGPFERIADVGPRDLLRRIIRPAADVAVVPGRGRPKTWFAGRIMVLITPGGFVIRRPRRLPTLARAVGVTLRGSLLALRIGLRGKRTTPMRAAPSPRLAPADRSAPAGPHAPSLGVIILSHNRWPALRRTLDHLTTACALPPDSILVVDNASTDGTPDHVAKHYPDVGVKRFESNVGVDAFNAGVRSIGDDLVLILDDDARPDPEALDQAVALLAQRPDLAAVTFHPRHPETGASEWSFAASIRPSGDDHWPVMGCCNLVRRDDWERVGGYEGRYFLYRNDTDLALKLLALGRGVHFNPDWTVWHDSPAAARKSVRWHRIATRNWIWTARRHGRGLHRILGTLLGWAWAHRLAALSPARHWATLRGAVEGLALAAPRFEAPGAASRSFCRLLRLHLGTKTRSG